MPTFWRFANNPEGGGPHMRDADGAQQIQAIAAYLWQDGFDGKLPERNAVMPDTEESSLRVAAVWRVIQSRTRE